MTLPRVGFVLIELPVRRKLDGKRLDALQCLLAAAVQIGVEGACSCDTNIDFVAFP